jgi:hypothetical protein
MKEKKYFYGKRMKLGIVFARLVYLSLQSVEQTLPFTCGAHV